MSYFVYILRCADNTFYVGHAKNLQTRLKEHNGGHGAEYTTSRRPVRLVYSEGFDSPKAAILREKQLKRWTRAKKEALIAGELARLKQLSKRRS
jgi:putative endonuclease